MLSTNALFAVCCVFGFVLAVVMPVLAAWTDPVICGAVAVVLIGVAPFVLRGHQWSIVISGTAYVAAAATVAYLAFGPISESGDWAPGQNDLLIAGIAFTLWITGIVAAAIGYSLTAYPLALHLSLPVFAFVLFKVSFVFH